MNNSVTLEDVSLRDFSLDTLPLVKRLRTQHFAAPTEICIERAKLITEYLAAQEGRHEPAELMRARAINHYMTHREPLFLDDNLLAGGTTSKLLGAPIYPELFGLSVWHELDTIGTREVNPQLLTEEEAAILNFEVFPYWMDRNVLEVTRERFNNPECLELLEKVVFYISGKAGCISHCIPSYDAALHRGLDAVIAEAAQKEQELLGEPASDEGDAKILFYQAIQIALEGIVSYAWRLSHKAAELAAAETDPWRRQNLENMSEVCAHVPANPARTYREAVNSLWLCQVGIHGENINMAMSPGRLDQVLYPFYARDVEDNGLTVKEALSISCCLWLKIADNTNLVPEAAEKLWGGAGSTPAVTLGGVDAAGNDAVNDLTYILLKVTEMMTLRDPSMNARFHYEANDRRYRRRLSEVILNTGAIPAVHNDVEDIKTLANQGQTLEHARDYGIVGCVELASSGRDYVASSSIMLNLGAAMEMALLDGKRVVSGDEQFGPRTGDAAAFTSFEEFWTAFEAQLCWQIGQAVEMNELFGEVHQDILPTPLLSAFFEGCMESGTDLIQGGAVYNSSGASHLAFPDVCDSLNAIEFAVFQEGKMSMADLVAAVRTDFAPPVDGFLPYLKNKVPKFGEEDPVALGNSRRLVKLIYDVYQSCTNYRGGPYRPAYWTMTTHAGQGKLAPAMPSGRRFGEVYSSGITPASQAAKNLVEAYNAVASLPGEFIPGGEALNIKYTPLTTVEDREEYLDRFGDFIESYFRKGGLQVQYNVQSYETLIDAKEHPENYPEMIVRVSGYSAYFNDLCDAMKDELITRTQYNLRSGDAVPLPPRAQPQASAQPKVSSSHHVPSPPEVPSQPEGK